MWESLGHSGYTYHAAWPTVDELAAREDAITWAIQVNGKLRDRLDLPAETSDDEASQHAQRTEKVAPFISGKTIRKVIVVPRRLVNIVTD